MIAYLDLSDPRVQAEYDAFVSSLPAGGFMQASGWREVKNNWRSACVASLTEEGKIRGSMLILILKKEGGSFLYAPRGPVCDLNDREVLAELTEGAKKIALEEDAYLLRVDPYIEAHEQEKIDLLVGLGFSYTPNQSFHQSTQPRFNYMLRNLDGQTPEDLHKRLGTKCRSRIRRAKENGVECVWGGKELLDDFYTLYSVTGDRKKFSIRPKAYLERMLDAFGDKARVYRCSYEGKPLSAGLSVCFGSRLCYVYGASCSEHRDLFPAYLQVWEMMNWALEENCCLFDFQGIVLTPEESEELYQVYLFKSNFRTGEAVEFAGDFDLVFKKEVYERYEGAGNGH